MDVNLIFKIAAIGILVAVLNLILVRSGRDEQALLTTLAGLIVVLMMLLQQISDLFRSGEAAVLAVMDTAARIVAVCLVGALLAVLLKKTSPDMALLLALAVCLGVLAALTKGLEEVVTFLRELLEWGGLSAELFVPLLKTVGIALISRTGGALCRDAGEGAMAGLVEMAGAFAAILVSLPLFRAAWQMLEGLL